MRWRCLTAVSITVSLLCQSGCVGGGKSTVVVTDRDTDTVWVRVLLNAGSAYDPTGKEGLAFATATAVQWGYGSLARGTLTDRLAGLSAQIDVWVDRAVCGFDGRCPRAAWPEFSELFVSLFAEPQVGNEGIAYIVADQLSALENLRSDDARLARAVLQQRLYGDHPWAHPPEGTDHSVLDLLPSDIRDFWSTHYVSSGLMLGLAGNISGSEAGRFRQSLTDVLPSGKTPRCEPPAAAVDGLQVAIIEMPGQDPRSLLVGCPTVIVRGDTDFPAFQLANAWLGRHGGRLTELLDDKRDISFVCWSYVEHTEPYVETDVLTSGRPRAAQCFFIETQPAPVNTAFILNIILAELDELTARDIPTAGLDSARGYLAEHTRATAAHPAYRMGMQLDARWLGLSGFTDGITGALETTSAGDARRAVKRVVDPNNLVVVAVVPSGQALASQIMRHQISYSYPEGINRLDLRSEDLVYLAYTPNWDPRKMRILGADELFR